MSPVLISGRFWSLESTRLRIRRDDEILKEGRGGDDRRATEDSYDPDTQAAEGFTVWSPPASVPNEWDDL